MGCEVETRCYDDDDVLKDVMKTMGDSWMSRDNNC